MLYTVGIVSIFSIHFYLFFQYYWLGVYMHLGRKSRKIQPLSFVSFDSFDLNAYTVLYSFDSFDLINNIEEKQVEMNREDWDNSNGIKQLKIRK